MTSRIFLIPILAISLFSCSNEMSKAEYLEYLKSEDSGLCLNRIQDDFELRARWIPNRSFTNDSSLNHLQKLVLNVKPKINNDRGVLSYITKEEEKQKELIRYYNELGHKEFILELDGERIGAHEFYFEDYRGISDYSTYTLVFDLSSLKDSHADKVLIWNDPLLGLGSIKFRFKEEYIAKEQAIKII